MERRAEADWPHWPGRSEGTQRRERLERRLFSATDDRVAGGHAPRPEPAAAFLLFVPTPQGYSLMEGAGEPPRPGNVVSLGDGAYVVAKVGRSPLPADDRLCAYLERS